MEWKVAPSYKNATIQTVDEENRKAYVVETCDRCGGTGAFIIPGIFQGTCFKCSGSGKLAKWVKAYTPSEYEKYIKAVERARERKQEKRDAAVRQLEEESEINKAEYLKSFGYDPENPMVYLVYGENTYSIKDELKERGGRYHNLLNWYFTHEVEIPEGFILIPVEFDKIFNWNPISKTASFRDDCDEAVKEARAKYAAPSKSEYIGEIKERLRDMKVTLTGSRGFQSMYGYTIVYTFVYGDNVLVWMTTSEQNIEVNHEYLLTGTVKKFEEYNGVKQTHLSRCIIKEVA